VSDVQVVGLPDERLGETVLAWIRLKPGETAKEEEIRAFCRARLAHFKAPRRVVFMPALPKTGTGKIQKFRLREAAGSREAITRLSRRD
jgi:fatty-acyl-CoA synthase